jgi:FO synthase
VSRALSHSELENFPSLEWTDIEPRLSPAIREALEIALTRQEGNALSKEQLLTLANCEGDDLLGLLLAADQLRAELSGNLVTYVVNRNINFTNICFVGCKFCAFSRGPREDDTYFLSPDQVAAKAVEAWDLGATEVCIQGGLPHDLPPFYYRDILRAVKRALPRMHCHAFSPMEIVYGMELTNMPVRDYLQMLRDNGLDTLPGTAAEILDDQVLNILSRNKLSTSQWREVITTAHQLGIRSTSTLMYGHVETTEHWVNQLCCCGNPGADRRLHGIRSELCIRTLCCSTRDWRAPARPSPSTLRFMRLPGSCSGRDHNIQVSWVKLNRNLSQLCLRAGANDYGGTLMEENISREAGATAGQYTSPEQFQTLILEAGRIPAERNTTYSRLHIKTQLEALTSEHAMIPEFA